MVSRRLTTQVCVAGGGPAGMMLGYLLARAGVEVTVLEKHADFLRDFRGDTVHPSTMEVMAELGLLERFLQRPHDRIEQAFGVIGDRRVNLVDFRFLPVHAPFIAMMPQWDFLDFLAGEGRAFSEFQVIMQAEAKELLQVDGQVVGLRAATPDGELEVETDLVVGADGRRSTVREAAGLEVEDLGAPMDVLWLRLPRRPDDAPAPLGRIDAGRIFVMFPRNDYFQCGYVVAKGETEAIRSAGLEALRADIARMAPTVADRVGAIETWDDIKLLTVVVDRLKHWARPGLICIGDAAHAMSPVGGIGINLAIQDAVAAANILAEPLTARRLTLADLNAVQARREPPTKLIQGVQVFIQRQIIRQVLAARTSPRPPWPVLLLDRFPRLRRIPARLLGLGPRPEHVRTPDVHAAVSPAAMG
ncbi:MAG TPA: FAD-dependent oxidoreductase [Caulobacteraceae bacterium]|nr:FAD-dependent oxidoreductase [Caulobacteraceae bacterium]